MTKKGRLLLLAGLVDAQERGNQSFLSTIKGLSQEYSVCILTLVPKDQRNFTGFYENDEDIIVKRPGPVLSKVLLKTRGLHMKLDNLLGRRLRKIGIRRRSEFPPSNTVDAIADYGTVAAFIMTVFSFVAAFALSLWAIIELTRGKYRLIYGYEVIGVLAGNLVTLGVRSKPYFRRFQGTAIPLDDQKRKKLRYLQYRIAISSSKSPIIMANDGTHGDVIVKTLCPEAKLLFLPNGLPEQFISKVESVLREQSMEVGVGDELHCIAISKLKKWKRIDRSIDLANRLAAHLKKPVVLSVIGDGPELANLTALAEQKASKLVRIEFLGSMRHVDIVKLLVRADLFLSFYDISNLGNPLLEAVYCKKRIVTFNEMPTRKTIGESERFCFVERFDGEWPETELSKIVEFLGRPQTSAGGNGGTIMSWRSRMKKEIEFIEAQYV